MKIYCILGNGRSGVDFLQSLFDKHPQVSQFPGVFYFGEFWSRIKGSNKVKIANLFIRNHERFFNSKIYKQERHDKLGKRKNEFFKVNKKEFIKNFSKLCTNPFERYDVFLNLHLAYSKTCKENIKNKSIIIVNIHQINHLYEINDFEFEIILNLRNPISSLNSTVKHWMIFSKKNINLWWLDFHLDRTINILNDCQKLNKKIIVLKLDDIHKKNTKILNKLCKQIKIKFSKNMNKSTYHGKLWWGDKLSIKYLNGFNPKFKNSFDRSLFYKKDVAYLESKLKFYFKFFMFKKFSNGNISFFKEFLPLKMEIITWKCLLANQNYISFIKIPFYFFKRIILLNTKIKINKKIVKHIY